MADIKKMRDAFKILEPGMDIETFLERAGKPDSFIENASNGYYCWENVVWLGTMRGGNVHRTIQVFTIDHKIICWNALNLETSDW